MSHQHPEHVIIGVDPHKPSATIEVTDQRKQLLGSGRFTTDDTAVDWPARAVTATFAAGVRFCLYGSINLGRVL